MSSVAYQTRSLSWTIREWRRSAKGWSFELWLMKHEQNWIGLIEPIREGRYSIKASGTPQLRRNGVGIFPSERKSVSVSIVLGPPWRTESRPATSDRSTFAYIVERQ